MKVNKVIPLIRIFDEAKAVEFYVNWLGFTIDWTHQFETNFPLYIQVSKEGIVLHLTEHHGDCTPGGKVFIDCVGLTEYHAELIEKNYRFNRPGLEEAPWNAITMEVSDPFGNKLLFNESKE
ncbi:glyoxalase superfamily protein [Dyadobacter subterraneus]|uniref:VOC family protein n=1 Tax=Dyadobacter subterraneus TaxID=2773304 RepID=A0ABR9WL20_9BACT|nr:glyoxalase superfamily protein [Dyadobacter subterraneus]MBE9466212.1 VOC family protein [Dyadobacter subterraneus]